MRLIITTKFSSLILPINYQYIQQSIIYHHLSKEPSLKEFVHDRGWKHEERSYHMFQFSHLNGPFSVRDRQIMFQNYVSWEVRSIDSRIIQTLAQGIREEGVSYLDQKADEVELEIRDDEIESNSIHIRMKTPICLFSTDKETGKTYFYAPNEAAFKEQLVENFIRKYHAFTGVYAENGVSIEPLNVQPSDKFVTKYKGFILSGWKGEYQLTGNRKYLNFLYQVGLGARNAQGFGMFDVIEE